MISDLSFNIPSPVSHYWWYLLTIITVLFFLYKQFRPYFPVKVNCWFCKENQSVPYSKKYGFNCSSTSCGQYNGFTADGDYNKQIDEQYCQNDLPTQLDHSFGVSSHQQPTENTLCHVCNLKQQRKLEKLACFVPTREEYFDKEYRAYSRRLENIYELCDSCIRKTSLLLKKQDEHLRNIYFSTPNKRSESSNILSPFVDVFSPVAQSAREKQRSNLQQKISSLSFCNGRSRDESLFECNKISAVRRIFRTSLKFVNVLTSLVVLVYVVCECHTLKVHVITWLAHHPLLDHVTRSLFDRIVWLCLFGIVTQYFATRLSNRCRIHIGSFFMWIVTSLLVYNLFVLCPMDGNQFLHLFVISNAIINVFMSTICFSKEFFRSSPQFSTKISQRNLDKLKQDVNKNKVSQIKQTKQHGGFLISEKENKQFSCMRLSQGQHNVNNKDGSFLFFDHKVRTEEFNERLMVNPGVPQPLISPAKFIPGIEQPNLPRNHRGEFLTNRTKF